MLTIGQVARLFGISTKTLRHYEAIGVFRPVCYGRDNGYRYYEQKQLATLENILWLRSLGVSLDSIKSLSNARKIESAGGMRSILEEHA
ncbi:MerR family transcriptional regulator [Hahella ganghwensis]|uniref:MerR family transcriptional regulator n=1 Tax=Hahella ganghwensis TaxID=286420 RepID=UPI0003770A99|nr:MerR family transcriptional regulator [Hahella ganghwensis]